MKFLTRIQKFTDRPWYVPLISLCAALDMFLLVFPTDGFLVAASLSRPKKWISVALWITTGSAFGALVMGFMIRYFGDSEIAQAAINSINQDTWNAITDFTDHHGVWALSAIAAGPFPLQPGVIVVGLAKMPLLSLFLSVWLGRFIKYALFSWLAAHSPEFLNRLWFVRREIEQVKKSKPKN